MMEFIESPAFTRVISDYLKDEAYRELQNHLSKNPELGVVMPGTGGFRKLRWSDPVRGKGRRGGLRIIYYYFDFDEQIWLMTIYSKGEADDLSTQQKNSLKAAIEAELSDRRSKEAPPPRMGRRRR